MREFLLKIPSYTPTLIVTALILYFTLIPSPLPPDAPKMFPHADKLAHAIMFWAFYTTWAFDRARWQLREGLALHLSREWGILIMTSTLIFGAGTETLQWAMGLGRGADIADFAADAVGAIIASKISPAINRLILK